MTETKTLIPDHEQDVRTCDHCGCTRLTIYVNHARNGAPIDPVYVCQTPGCPGYDSIDVTDLITPDDGRECECGATIGTNLGTTFSHLYGIEVDAWHTDYAFALPTGDIVCEDCEAEWADR